MHRPLALAFLTALSACQPPAADDYVERVAIGNERGLASEALESPDTTDAIWAESGNRLLYGLPGERPLLQIACEGPADARSIAFTRFARADPQAKALMALIGNGHVERMKVDAQWNGKAWLWQARYAASDPRLDVLTGPREVELTIPGAGSVVLNPSQKPRVLIDGCRGMSPLPPAPEAPVSVDAPPTR